MSENIDDATQLSDTTRLSDSTQLSDSTHLSDATHLASAPHTGTTPSTESAPQSVALPNLPQRPSQAPSEKPSPTTDAASIPAGDDSTVLKPRKGSTPAIPQQATAQSQPQSQPQRQSSKAAQAAASALPASINSGLLPQPHGSGPGFPAVLQCAGRKCLQGGYRQDHPYQAMRHRTDGRWPYSA